MKISIFTYSISRQAGGVRDAVRSLFLNKNMKVHDLSVFSYKDEYSDEERKHWHGVKLQLYKAGWFLYSEEAKKALLSSGSEILHMQTLWRAPQWWMASWKKHTGKPVICTPHGMLDPYILQQQGFVKRLMGRIAFGQSMRTVDCWHALCKKELEDIRDYGLMQPVAIIPNGVDLPDDGKIYERPDNQKHLLYLGRLHKKKGVDLLLKAIAKIKQEHSGLLHNWHIDIVGWNHENCQATLEQIVSEHHLENYVTFHGGLFGDDKMSMYATSDAYILPSHGEGLPITVLEAWSWKLPVLMTPECHIPEGFDADAAIEIADNVDSVKEGIQKLFSMTDTERKSIGQRGYELVQKQFTWDESAKKINEVYEWLMRRRTKPEFVYE
ncbi:MAG: glycosyltransferase [Prevotellaceae bacterium]|nr:glycosyltransferase [Prevotellaceae bacterium]